MINFILIYFISYFLTFLGFLLAKEEIVKDELKEIQRAIKFSIDFLLIISYLSMLYFFSSNGLIIFTTLGLILLKILSHYKKSNIIKQIHNILLFGATLVFTYKFADSNLMYLAIFPIIILFIENTNQKFDKHDEIWKFILLSIILIILNVI